jgi:hypothetical protein
MLDCLKANNILKWKSIWGIEKSVCTTIDWYKNFYIHKAVQTEKDLLQYISDANRANLIWTE